MDYKQIKAKEERDREHVWALGHYTARGGSVPIGLTFNRWINQADRFCQVFATRGTRYAYDYEMPSGAIFVRIGDTATRKERSVSERALPKWIKGTMDDHKQRGTTTP